ncbi:MAG: hypothetical protein ACM3TR_08105 [Caulobacteraceae bacterium]
MEWIIHFTAIWIVLSLLGGWKWAELSTNIWCGTASIILHLIIDTERIRLGLYRVENPVISIFGSSLFFTFGASFVSGMLIAVLQPRNRWVRILHVLIFTAVFTIEEYMLVKTGAVVYINWSLAGGSLPVNLMAIMSLSWFSIVILGRGRE